MLSARVILAATWLVIAATSCGPATQTELFVAIDKDPAAALPEYLSVTVLRDGTPSVVDLRVPDKGSLTSNANPIATVQITLDGNVFATRDISVSAVSGGAVVAKAELLGVRIGATASRRLQLSLSSTSDSLSVPMNQDAGVPSPTDAALSTPKPDAAASATDGAIAKLDAPKPVVDTAPPAPVNLISNGGFEAGVTKWKTVNGNTAAVAAGPSSAFALRSDTAAAWCQQETPGFIRGQTYVLTATGKGDVVGCTVGVVCGNDVDGEIQRNIASPFGTTWKTEARDFVVPAAATWMFVFIHNNGSPTCWTDDVSLLLKQD